MLEKDVIKHTLNFTKKHGIKHIRFVARPGVTVGWPDFIFLIPGGRALFIEFKATGKKPSKKQEEKISELKEAGYDVEVCDGPDEACEAITRALDAARVSKESV